MKLHFVAMSALAGLAAAQTDRVRSAMPVQTFFVSMPEDLVFQDTFLPIREGQSYEARSPIVSITSFAISVNNTVIWYDHWEDGFDDDVTDVQNRSSTTEVWGDGNASNGCAPGVSPCTNANDVLVAGKSYVAENKVAVNPRDQSIIFYDGGDKVQSSFGIAMTRGQYPVYPGPYMAGAIEVYDTNSWGYKFEMPVGQKMTSASFGGSSGQARLGGAFEISTVYLMAAEDNTTITKPDKSKVTLAQGQSLSANIDMGDVFTSDKKIQAAVTTADKSSLVELRWFSLLSTDQWSKSYLSPIGDTETGVRVVLYNNNPTAITVKVKTPSQSYSKTVPARAATWTDTVKDNEGALVSSDKNFVAWTMIDTAVYDHKNYNHQDQGRAQDWGFPVVPTDMLSSEVLIGWGYGCTGNNCADQQQQASMKDKIGNTYFSRTLVFVSPIEDCTFYVSFDNNGVVNKQFNANALSSHKISDTDDFDMTGAVIWAAKRGTGASGAAVKFAAAWGQDPNAQGGDIEAMDLGTVVLPFDSVRVTERVELDQDLDNNGVISPGDILKYTIRVQNTGQLDIWPNHLTITGPILAENLKQRTYVSGSCRYDNADGSITKCNPDNGLGSSGLKNPVKLNKRGGYHDITFKAEIVDIHGISTKQLPQGGVLKKNGINPLPFSAPTTLHLSADISIEKTVHKGTLDNCNTKAFVNSEVVSGVIGANVTYCYLVTNTGETYLKPGQVKDNDINFASNALPMLAPGQQSIAAFPTYITKSEMTMASITADPVFKNDPKTPIESMASVSDEDNAGVRVVSALSLGGAIRIEKTVHHDSQAPCSDGDERAHGYDKSPVTYCYKVINVGKAHLTSIRVTDPEVKYSGRYTGAPLAPDSFVFMAPFPSTITKTITSSAVVLGLPSDKAGNVPPNALELTDKDDAGVVLLLPKVTECK